MPDIPLNIVQFIEHPALLNDQSLSVTQRAILKSFYGIPLDETELAIYCKGTAKERYVTSEQREGTVIAGRRSGKTSRIAAPIVIYESFRDHGLPRGEKAFALLLAPQLAQAEIAFRAIGSYLRKSQLLSKRIKRETKNEISLDNGVTIACSPSSYIVVRGVSIIAAICDEMAFWRHESCAANPEQEVLDALDPGLANVKHSKLIKISTPFGKRGALWTEFEQRTERDSLVWQVPTSEMNPSIDAADLEARRQRNPQTFRREFMAEFSDSASGWIAGETLNQCIVRGRSNLPPVRHTRYIAAIDPAFLHDDFALCIAHLLESGTVALDLLVRWRGSKQSPLDFEEVINEIMVYLKDYNIVKLSGDQYCASVIRRRLRTFGIDYEEFHFGAHTRAQIFGNLKHLLTARKIELLDNSALLEQLRNLEERMLDGGRIDIQVRGGMRDDLAVVVAMVVRDSCAVDDIVAPPQLGLTQIVRSNYHPTNCRVATICANFPRCVDENFCQGFKDERLTSIKAS